MLMPFTDRRRAEPAALRRAEALAEAVRARLEVVTVVSAEGVDPVEPRLGVEGVRLDGDPAMELIRHCEENVDLLVLGSRGYGPIARVLLGSVSRRVVTDAPCPVLFAARP